MSKADCRASRNYQRINGGFVGRVRGGGFKNAGSVFQLSKWFRGLFPDKQKQTRKMQKGIA